MNRFLQPFKRRFVYLGIFLIFLFSLLVIQFFKLQIVEGDRWSKVAMRQHYIVMKEPFARGSFFGNSGLRQGHPDLPQKLVVDIEKFHLYADSMAIPEKDRETVTRKVALLLELDAEGEGKIRAHLEKKSRSRKLASWLDKEQRDLIHDWWKIYAKQQRIAKNALFFVSDYKRSYPYGKLLGQVLHTIRDDKDPVTRQAIPTGGLELAFHSYLSGREGRRLLMRSPRHAFATGEVVEEPRAGASIYLTIDPFLQAVAEEELAKGVKKSKAKGGWAVMMDPRTGEILVMAQYPFFQPEEYQRFFNDPELLDATRVKAVSDGNEPGSIMKPLTLAIALKANEELRVRGEKPLFDPEEKIATSNGFFPGRSKELKDTRRHNYLNMWMGLQKSSNVYMARLVQRIVERLGKEWYRAQLEEIFGFGQKTGIELPGETAGVLPKIGKLYPNGIPEWSYATPYSLAIGHNIQANSLQMLRAYAVLANGGYLVRPTLVRKIVASDGQEIARMGPSEGAPAVLSTPIIREVKKAMKYVTKKGGSAPKANVRGYSEAGKTGTAEKIIQGKYSKAHYCSSFVGFAPCNDPAFVLIVSLDEPEVVFIPGLGKNHHGGTSAAPVFREIAQRTLDYLGTPYDDPHGYPVGDPRYDHDQADWVKEAETLQALYEKWNL